MFVDIFVATIPTCIYPMDLFIHLLKYKNIKPDSMNIHETT